MLVPFMVVPYFCIPMHFLILAMLVPFMVVPYFWYPYALL
jgi:hypothetical protein